MKIVLVTGGSSGIGLQTVLSFHQAGYKIITCSRNEEKWNACLSRYPELSDVDYFSVDLKDVHQVDRLFAYIKANYGYLDIAINNASPTIGSRGTFKHVPINALYSTLIDDFWVHALCIHYELALMDKGCNIINLSAVAGKRPGENVAMFSASKHALEGLTRSVALEAIKYGVRVNAIAPGVTWTPRWEATLEQVGDSLREKIANQVPCKRFAEPKEIAEAILWLCSDKASYVVGHTLLMDGGLSLT